MSGSGYSGSARRSYLFTWGQWTVSNTSPSWLTPYDNQGTSQLAVANPNRIIVPRNLTLSRMKLRHATPVLAINLVYTVQLNGVNTALALTLNSGAAGPVQDLGTLVNANENDELGIICTHAAGGPFGVRVRIMLEGIER